MMRRILPVIAFLALGASVALAQQAPTTPAGTSDLMLSWRSNGFAPAGYPGRVAAAGGGTVLLTVEALVGGRPANLSTLEIRWYVNDDLFESGLGRQAVTVPVDRYHQDSMDVRVEIVGAPFASSIASMSVPLTDPVAVIEARSGTTLHEGVNEFAAVPYSFNVTNPRDLLYSWTVNGDIPQAAQDPRSLNIDIEGAPVDPVDISLGISHPQNDGEAAGADMRVPAPQQ